MATTKNTYTGNGSTTNYAFTFPYINQTDVKASVAGTVTTAFTFANATTLAFNTAPANNAAIVIYRSTDDSNLVATFYPGSAIRSTDLNDNYTQNLYSTQENTNDATDALSNSRALESGVYVTAIAKSITALSTANTASTDATNAVSTANSASASATTAVNTANTANTTAGNAVNTANAALPKAGGAMSGNITMAGSQTVDGRDLSADGSKLDGIETAATADQTNAEIRAAVEAATDSNVFTDADHSKLNAIEASATADQTVTEIKSLLASDNLNASHLAANSVTTSEITDLNVTTAKLATDAVTAAKIGNDIVNSEHYAAASIDTEHIADANVTTAKIADVNVTTGKIADNAVTFAKLGCEETTLTANSNATIPTSKAVSDYVVALLNDVGGFYPILDDQKFPNANPDPGDDAGTIVSIADAGGLVVNGSGVSTTGRTLGGSTVTINNIDSTLYNTTIAAGKGMLVQTTSTLNTYDYHRLTLDEAGVAAADTLITDFNQRYRVNAGEPSSHLTDGDLVFDTSANKMKVYDSSASAWKEVTSAGDFKYLYLCPAGGTGAPTINGSIATYDLREGSNSGSAASVTSAAQLMVSVNGVTQQPNTGTSAPALGFALVDSNTIIFGANLPTSAEVFIIQSGSALTITTPGDSTVTEAKIASAAVTTAKIADDAVDGAKLANNIDIAGTLDVTGVGTFDSHINLPNVNTFMRGGGHDVIQVDATRTYFYGGSNGVQLRKADNSAEIVTVDDSGNTVIGPWNEVSASGEGFTLRSRGQLLQQLKSDTSEASAYVLQKGDAAKVTFTPDGAATFKGALAVNRAVSGDGCFHAQLNGTTKASITSAGDLTAEACTLARATVGTATSTGFYSVNAITNSTHGSGWSAIYAQNKTAGGRVFGVLNAAANAETVTILENGNATLAGEVTLTDELIIADTISHHGDSDTKLRFPAANTFVIETAGAERMRVDSLGEISFNATTWNRDNVGIGIGSGGWFYANRTGGPCGTFTRGSNDGDIIELRQDNTKEGSISVSGTTVSFNGGHLSRWSQLPSAAERTQILRGSVLSNLDEMCEWGTEDNEQLNRMKVSDVEGDKNVSGVFQSWDDDDDTYKNDFYCAMTGDFVIRIAKGTTVSRGDLLMSAGDGTAKPQDDDIVRSKTIAKVTSTVVSETYSDNSYCVPCVLMAC